MDFLTFQSFISTEALIVFYYAGAIMLPVSTWYFVTWLQRKYEIVNIAYEKGKATLWGSLNQKNKIRLTIFFIVTFLFMELFWRMLFEFLIAYMQIRDALLQP
jgi:hypothetical protein